MMDLNTTNEGLGLIVLPVILLVIIHLNLFIHFCYNLSMKIPKLPASTILLSIFILAMNYNQNT
jgi:hypothetical protein